MGELDRVGLHSVKYRKNGAQEVPSEADKCDLGEDQNTTAILSLRSRPKQIALTHLKRLGENE